MENYINFFKNFNLHNFYKFAFSKKYNLGKFLEYKKINTNCFNL
jgi:hypothetical protein